MAKSIKKSLALGTMGAAALAAVVVPTASAAVEKYTAVSGGNYNPGVFRLKREINGIDASDKMNVTYEYSVEYMKNASASSETPIGNLAETATIEFKDATPAEGSGTVTGYANFDLTAWKPAGGLGDYYYLIKETKATGTDAENNPAYTNYGYILAISVRNANDDNGATDTADIKVASQLFLVSSATTKDSSDFNSIAKVDGIITTGSNMPKYYLTLINKNSGDMADTTDCFEYTITVDSTSLSADADISLNVNGASCYEGSTAPTSVKAGRTATVKLAHGDSVYIGRKSADEYEIPYGSTYTYTVAPGSTSGYTLNSENVGLSGEVIANMTTTVNNYKAEASLTGVILNILPFAILVALGVVGFSYSSNKSKKTTGRR